MPGTTRTHASPTLCTHESIYVTQPALPSALPPSCTCPKCSHTHIPVSWLCLAVPPEHHQWLFASERIHLKVERLQACPHQLHNNRNVPQYQVMTLSVSWHQHLPKVSTVWLILDENCRQIRFNECCKRVSGQTNKTNCMISRVDFHAVRVSACSQKHDRN